MARMLSQLPLPLLPGGAAEIAPGVGLAAGDDGSGLVTVHGLATFAWDAGDEAGRRLAAVQLVRLRAASQGQVAEAFGVDPGTIWRWDQALAAGGVAGLVPARRGPKGASKLTPRLAARIAELDAAGATLREVAAATGCRRSACATRSGGWRPQGSTRWPAPPKAARAWTPGTVRRARARRFRCCRIRCRGTASGCWPGGGCWGGRCPGVHCGRAVPAGRAAAGAAGAGGRRPAGCRARGVRAAAGRILRAGRDVADAGVPGAGRGAAGRGRHPGAARRRWAGCSGWTGRRRSRRSAASSPSWPPPGRPPT